MIHSRIIPKYNRYFFLKSNRSISIITWERNICATQPKKSYLFTSGNMLKLISLTILAGLLSIDATLYATRIPNQSDCLIVYTKWGFSQWTVYKFQEGYHIQADRPDYLAEFEVWHADWCIMYSDTVTSSLWNSQACYTFRLFNKIS
jgi:hypothetical protein